MVSLISIQIETERLGGIARRKRRDNALEYITPIPDYCPRIPAIQTHLAGKKERSVILKNLRKFTRYSVTVRIYNSVADGPKSKPYYFKTLEDSKEIS